MMSNTLVLSGANTLDGFDKKRISPNFASFSEDKLQATLNKLNFIGQSATLQKTLKYILKFCCSKAPILLEGETGSGKELAARALHYLGPRKSKPFIPVNCGSFPETMFENELFGHSKGAFTDAKTTQTGLIEQAEGGTLFLDEIDSLPAKAQVSLLRFLQDQQYRPIGTCRLLQSDINVIAATNVALSDKVRQGLFREDLLFRINVISIAIPPLRKRKDDILLLANHFLATFEKIYAQGEKALSAAARQWMLSYHWPGNIRELQNMMHKEYLLAEGSEINLQIREPEISEAAAPVVNLQQSCYSRPFSAVRQQVLEEFEYQYLHQLMQMTSGNISHAARIIEKERRSLGRLLEKHGIDKNAYLN